MKKIVWMNNERFKKLMKHRTYNKRKNKVKKQNRKSVKSFENFDIVLF